MSVPVGKRGYQKLEVLTKAIGLADYTIKICKNEKNFPKRDRWILTNRIVQTAIDVVENVRKGNAVRVENEDDFSRRRAYQQNAAECCEFLLTLIDIAYRNLGLASDKVEYWVSLAIEEEQLLSKWRKSDRDAWAKKMQQD